MKKGILLSLSLLLLSSTMTPIISAQEDTNDTESTNEQVTSEAEESSSVVEEESDLPEEGLRVLTYEEAVEYANNHPERVASYQRTFEGAIGNPEYGIS